MNIRMKLILGPCAVLMLGLSVKAQDFGAAAGVAGAGGAAAPAAAAGPNLFTALLPPPEMAERCRQKLCKCEIVKLLRASLGPASAATGGLIPVGNCCPTIKKEDLAKPADSSEGAAARIKKDAEEAAARREAVRYLGTVDCRYWPEAEEALINALRADKIECVRYEAAVVLQRGCCCTKKIAKALTICIEGTEKDGHPAERSVRVQDAAAVALSMCVFDDRIDPKVKEDEKKKIQGKVDPKEYYRNLDNAANESVYDGARKLLEKRNNINSTQVLSQTHRASSQGLIGMFSHAVESSADVPAAPTREPQATTAVANQQPQRRGLLYKLLPSSSDEAVAYNPPVAAPRAVATPQPITTAQPQRPPVANEIRPVGHVNTPVRGTMIEEPGFSTAGPSNLAPTPRPAPPAVPTSSNTAPRPAEQGLLGFVIMDDAPARR